MVILARIDDRLIHGQVVEGWVNSLKATCIMVADDRVAANPLQRTIMEISAPEGLKVIIGTVADICDRLRSSSLDGERAIVLFSNPADVLRALRTMFTRLAVLVTWVRYGSTRKKFRQVRPSGTLDSPPTADWMPA